MSQKTRVEIELLDDEVLARSFRTFTPEPHEPQVVATLSVQGGALFIDTKVPGLADFLRAAIKESEGPNGTLQLNGHHTSKRVGRGTLNKHFPGDWVGRDDPRYPEGLTRTLCYRGENIPEQRFDGKVLHARMVHS